MATVIVLNGPAGSGKDSIAAQICNNMGAHRNNNLMYQMEFKQPLYAHVAQLVDMDYDSFMYHYQDREWKEEPRYNGHSVRDLMIATSEVYLKPLFGQDYFGKALAGRITQYSEWQHRPFLVTDGGFKDELDAVVEAGHNVALVHLHREGCTFEGDSRDYVLTNTVPRIYTLNNNGTIEDAVARLEEIYNEHLGHTV